MFSTAKLLIWPEEKASENAERSHQVDSLNLLIFVCLLILTILTVWLFKRVRIRFVHETGLSIIYGLIVGAIIKYSSSRLFPHPSMPQVESTAVFNNVTTPQTSPNYLIASSIATFMNITEPPDQVKDITATFDPEVFFNVLLPPIIFHAGYSMKKKHFFKNFGTIALFAFVGTLVSSFVTGVIMFLFMYLTGAFWLFGDCLKFGSLISATDPVSVLTIFNDLNVDVDLYALVFGESVLNDAVAIVLVRSVSNVSSLQCNSSSGFDGLAVVRSVGNFIIVFFGAFALGIAMGFVTALMTKFTHIKDHPLLESSLFVLMSYCTFLAAEAAQMTGIVALLFCGICQAHYTYSNMSTESKARTKQVFELLNFLAENFVFVYIGVSTFTFKKHIWNIPFIFMAFFAIIIARALNIYPLSLLLNIGRTPKIPANFQHFMMFSGLRGAMAFALSIRGTSTKEECTIFTTTLVIVMSTIILSGGFTTQMLSWLKIKVGLPEHGETQGFETLHSVGPFCLFLRPQRYVMDQSSSRSLINRYGFFRLWYMFDSRFLKPLLTHSRPPLTDTLPKCCLPLSLLLTTEQQKQQVRAVWCYFLRGCIHLLHFNYCVVTFL
ncbi:hypothetical protein HELRODRAFT_64443 [Helobdella robusta]|uniref:Sodium/hydrogen exchanger n=1 Tax=Helobdella robusta TaxID=6412 RepID=T1FXV0_HELRO|nr:hypothetical protein HELRODRAFT_64443 [Helobdella robusta]ESO06161.1 hypothetical protein HELRODRAFT_64443 [Helobdella robusta]